MLLRNLPIADNQTVHPMPWLFAREQDETHEAHQAAIRALDSEVAQKFVYQGGMLIYVATSGNWIVVAEKIGKDNGWIPRNKALWNRVHDRLPYQNSPAYNSNEISIIQ